MCVCIYDVYVYDSDSVCKCVMVSSETRGIIFYKAEVTGSCEPPTRVIETELETPMRTLHALNQ